MSHFELEDEVVIRHALLFPEGTLVPLGKADQAQIDKRRQRLHYAALAQPEPVEILTIPGEEPGTVSFKVRRFHP